MTDKNSNRFPPSITATKLYEKTSAKGNPYLTGRWGNLRVAVLKTQNQDDDGNAIWEMRLSAAPPTTARAKSQEVEPRQLTYTAVDPDGVGEAPAPRNPSASGFGGRAHIDEEIPL